MAICMKNPLNRFGKENAGKNEKNILKVWIWNKIAENYAGWMR